MGCKMKTLLKIIATFFVVMLLASSALAQVNWIKQANGQRYLAWSNGESTITINRGESATFTTGYFTSTNGQNPQVRLQAFLNDMSTGSRVATLADHNVDVSQGQGYEEITITLAHYQDAGQYVVLIKLDDGQQQVSDVSLTLTVNEALQPVNHAPQITQTPNADLVLPDVISDNFLFPRFVSRYIFNEQQWASETVTFTGTDQDSDPVAMSYSGNLPSGVSPQVRNNVLTISGVPTQSGNFDFTVMATDGQATTAKYVRLSVAADSDRDGIPDRDDNAPGLWNPDQSDSDGDGVGDIADNPTFVGTIASQTVAENAVLEIPFSVRDPNNEALTAEVLLPSGVSPRLQSINGEAAPAVITNGQGKITLQPAYTFVRHPATQDYFDVTLRVRDNGAMIEQTFRVTVKDVNRAPQVDSFTIPVTEDQATNVLLNGHDDDTEDTLTYTIIINPQRGRLSGAAPNLIYTPNTDDTGADSFTFKARDQMQKESNIATVTLNVNSVNDVPSATAGTFQTPEDTLKPFVLAGKDDDGDALTYAIVTPPLHGTLGGTAPNLVYTPTADYHGPDSLTFTVTDATGATGAPATIGITVTPINDAPVAQDQNTATTTVGTAVTINLVATDVEGSITSYHVTQPLNGAATLIGTGPAVSYQPNPSFRGTDRFTFTATDGEGLGSNVATVIVRVNENDLGLNVPPRAIAQNFNTPENTPFSITLSGIDDDGTITSAALVIQPQRGSLTPTADTYTYTYTPETNYNGADSFTFTVTDNRGATSQPATIGITVSNVNALPNAFNQAVVTNVNTARNIHLVANDPDGTVIDYLANQPTHGNLVGAGADYIYTPNPNYVGADSFTFTVVDNEGARSASATVTITVTDGSVPPANVAPVAFNRLISTPENTAVNVVLEGADVDGTIVAYTFQSNPQHGTLTATVDPYTYIYTPAQDYNGVDTFTFAMTDDDGAVSNVATVTILVTAVHHAPLITSRPITVATVGNQYTYQVTVTADSPVTYALVKAPEGMTMSSTGLVQWLPEEEGYAEVTLSVSDGISTVQQSYMIQINSVPQDVKISSVRISQEVVAPGEEVLLRANVQNYGAGKVTGTQIRVIIYDLGIYRTSTNFNIRAGEEVGQNVYFEIPQDAQPGDYLVKVTSQNNEAHDAMYRIITVQ